MILERHVGEHTIRLEALSVGNDLVVIISGGDVPHVGSISVGFTSPSQFRDAQTKGVSTISLPGHKDYVLSTTIAERLIHELDRSVIVNVGIHIDNATKTEIDAIIKTTEEIVTDFIKMFRQEVR